MQQSAERPRRVFLHVGSPKTGTTFLQQVLWAQRDRARTQGLLLPGSRFFDHFLASLDVRGLGGRPEHPPEAEGMWDRLVAESLDWSGDVLVSHELFAAATPEQAERAIGAFGADAEVHVVLTVRDLVRQIPAEWQEHVKHRARQRLSEFVTSLQEDTDHRTWFWQVQDFADVAERWGGSLPRSRVHVVTVPPAGADPGVLWTRFASLLELDPVSFDTTASQANTSLGAEQVELLRRVNAELGDRLPIPGPYPTIVKNVLAHRILASRKGARLALDVPATEFAVRRSREIADRLTSMQVHVVGDLEELVPDADTARSTASRRSLDDDIPHDVLLAESVAALAALLVILRQDRAHYERLVADLKKRPVRFVLERASERNPALARARRVYQRRRALTGRLRRRSDRRPARGRLELGRA